MNEKMGKLLKKIVYVVLGVGIALSLYKPTNAVAADLSFQSNAISNISNNDARISAQIINNSKMNVTETGFYLGTSSGALSKCSNKDSGSWKYSKISVGFTMSKYWGALSENTTYYYCFYSIADGREYTSGEYSFKTTGGSAEKAGLSFYENSVTDVTENNGRINAKISNPDGRRVTETGFYIGTSDQLYQNAKHDDCDLSDSTITVGYTMSQYYGALQPGTTYYYMYYAVGDGEEFFSDIYSFTTEKSKNTESKPITGGGTTTPKESQITFSIKKVEEITHESARIGAVVNNPKKENITETGFYYGTDKNNMIKSIDSDKGNWKTGISVSYDVSKYARVCLMADKTYYYQLYVIADGQEVKSEVNAFTISKEDKKQNEVQFDIKLVTEITSDNARIRTKINNPEKSVITETGFYIGTKEKDLEKNSKNDIGKWSVSLDVSFSLREYYSQKLKADTVYYYKFYVIVDGKEYCSDVASFKTTEIKNEEVRSGKYKEINWWNSAWDNVTDFTPNMAQTPWVVQESNGCSIASLAMCAMINQTEGLSTSEPQKALDTVRADNKRNNPGNPVWMSGKTWEKYKYNKSISYPSNEQIYECLKNGPVICHKTFTNQDNVKDCSHFSVIVGYNGSEEKLNASGFVVKDVVSYKGVRSRNKNLAIWASDRLPYEKNIVFDRINYFEE